VKNLLAPVVLRTLTDDSEGKSYLMQLVETRQMRDLLGLKDEVQLAVVGRTGITREAKAELERLGFVVHGTVVDC
jgi:hypothetical protein